jgi:lambda family phage portal protein
MIARILDRAIGVVAPAWAFARAKARASMAQVEAFEGGPGGGYDAGKISRLNRAFMPPAMSENGVPRTQVDRLRSQSWNLFRNNPHARKIVRSIVSKVAVLHPQSQAKDEDGKPLTEFRAAAQQLFAEWGKRCDYRGPAGFGGQTFESLTKTGLAGVILSGEILYRPIPVDVDTQAESGLPVPLKLQLIHAERLSETAAPTATGRVFGGIELDGDGKRTHYHILPQHPSEPFGLTDAAADVIRVPADQIGHVFVSDDIDQLRGTPWLAAALSEIRDTGDYQYNELKASAIGACVTLGVRRPQGATSFGIQTDDWELSDADGNPLTAMQPGMIVDLGTDGEIQGFNPQRPGGNAESFIQHMLRSVAAALPGVKSSTLTGDYRGSSFSSERSADNDAWPELEDVQDWWAESFYQPIYEAVIRAGVESGYFDDLISAADFVDRQQEYLACDWQGPQPRSINPTDDALGAQLRIANGTSSVPVECAKVSANWRDVLKSTAEFIEYARELEIPENLIDQFAGLNAKVAVAEAKAGSMGDGSGGDLVPRPAGPSSSAQADAEQASNQPSDKPADKPAAVAGTGQELQTTQATVLNGAQVTSASAIVEACAAGRIPRDSALGQLEILFNLSTEQANKMLGSAGLGTATTPNKNPAATPDPGPQSGPPADKPNQDQPTEPPSNGENPKRSRRRA